MSNHPGISYFFRVEAGMLIGYSAIASLISEVFWSCCKLVRLSGVIIISIYSVGISQANWDNTPDGLTFTRRNNDQGHTEKEIIFFIYSKILYVTFWFETTPPQSRNFWNFWKLSTILRTTIEIPWTLNILNRLSKVSKKWNITKL